MTSAGRSRLVAQAIDALRHGWAIAIAPDEGGDGALELLPAETGYAQPGLFAARLLVSADTAMPHLADAYAVPCLTFFTTHRPEWRARDYPLARSVYLPVQGLPDALEFARGPEDAIAARAAWFSRGANLVWLADAVRAVAADATPPLPAPRSG